MRRKCNTCRFYSKNYSDVLPFECYRKDFVKDSKWGIIISCPLWSLSNELYEEMMNKNKEKRVKNDL